MQFQFTPLREGRPHIRFRRRNEHLISIHAPPRGATWTKRNGRDSPTHFNSRPSARGDWGATSQSRNTTEFQFTPLREGRLIATMLFASDVYFNSRPSARGDLFLLRICVISNWISIHAPPRGATRKGRAHGNIGVFQFTPLREGRLIY